MNDDRLDGSGATGRDQEGALPSNARRRAILKALAAAGPVILTVTPFYARAEYFKGQYFEGSCAHDNRSDEHGKCFPNDPHDD